MWPEEMYKKTKIKSDVKTLISGTPNQKVLAALAIVEQDNVPEGTVKVTGSVKKTVMADMFGESSETKSAEFDLSSTGPSGEPIK